jgi:hypothetical protein
MAGHPYRKIADANGLQRLQEVAQLRSLASLWVRPTGFGM